MWQAGINLASSAIIFIILQALFKQKQSWCQKSLSDQLRRSSLHTLGWWLQTSTLMAVITVMFQKRWEIPEAQIKPRAVLIWWISSTLFRNSSNDQSGFARRRWEDTSDHLIQKHLYGLKSIRLNRYGISTQHRVPSVWPGSKYADQFQ